MIVFLAVWILAISFKCCVCRTLKYVEKTKLFFIFFSLYGIHEIFGEFAAGLYHIGYKGKD